MGLHDDIGVRPAESTRVDGFPDDTNARAAVESLGAPHGWLVDIEKRIPVAAGLGGGSSDAATALRLANAQLDRPRPARELTRLAAGLGADVPFFLADGPQLGTGDGSELTPLDLPQQFAVLLWLPRGAAKVSTRAVYEAFDARDGAAAFEQRADALHAALAAMREPADLARLPRNDLATSPAADELVTLGAFRADVSGAGPILYGLFADAEATRAAARSLAGRGRLWETIPSW